MSDPRTKGPLAMTVDDLAQIIRRVDGKHSLGAGELAERILAALDSPPVHGGGEAMSTELVERERQWCLSCGTITRTGRCDCSDDSPEAQRLVNYADEVSSEARKLSEANTALKAKVALLTEALKQIDYMIGGSIRGNGESDFTLNLDGEKHKGPAVEFLGYALTSLQELARRALSEPDKNET